MTKEYALDLLNMCDQGTLEYNSSLANEAYRYLERLYDKQKNKDKNLLTILDTFYSRKQKRN